MWFGSVNYIGSEPWEGKIGTLSGQLDISVPVDRDLPWYNKPFQRFRLERRVPYKNGLINGTLANLDQDGHETYIQQYRDGKEHGIYCCLNSDGSFSHLFSYRNGVLDGPCISCWTNGLLSFTDIYSNGEANGLTRYWSSTGELKQEGVYAHHQPIGKHTFWLHHNGAKSHEILYSTNGVPTQTTVWAADGSCIGTGTYKDGHEWDGYFAMTGKGSMWLDYYSAGKCVRSQIQWLKDDTQH
jgi:antitoxin component YwqK of YwqJK toxin-antitoxin module